MQLGLSQNVSMRLEQKLSPQMIQSLKLLQVTALQLETLVEQELEQNPLLEPAAEMDQRDEAAEAAPAEPSVDGAGEVKDDHDDGELSSEAPAPGEQKEEVDWDKFLDDGFDAGFRRSEEPNPDASYERVTIASRSLQDHLLSQLQLRHLTPRVAALAEYLVNCLDDDAYLKPETSLEVMAVKEDGDPAHAEFQQFIAGRLEETQASQDVREALHVLRSLDPAGVGARNLRECLLLQVRRHGGLSPLAVRILEEKFPLLEKLKLSALARELAAPADELQAAVREIGALDPHPGRRLVQTASPAVVPDLIVMIEEGEIVLLYNDRFLPSLRISRNYLQLLKKGSKAKADEKKFVRDKLNSATWLIRAIEQRRSTMLKVMDAIIKSQPEFFRKGPTYLNPIILQDIAEKIEMHISTVSRVINGKYVQTPHGVFELKYFFSTGMAQQGGDDISSVSIRDDIRQLIEGEERAQPLSDQAIVGILQKKGLTIARRTVAKYRDQLKILPARLRAQL